MRPRSRPVHHGPDEWTASETGNGSKLDGRDQLEAAIRLLERGDTLLAINPGQTHEGLRSYVWGSFGEVTAPETLLIPMNNETSEQIADLF